MMRAVPAWAFLVGSLVVDLLVIRWVHRDDDRRVLQAQLERLGILVREQAREIGEQLLPAVRSMAAAFSDFAAAWARVNPGGPGGAMG